MSEKLFLEATYDKFIFRASVNCLYHPGECWAREDGGLISVGITDIFLQQAYKKSNPDNLST